MNIKPLADRVLILLHLQKKDNWQDIIIPVQQRKTFER